MNFLHNGNDLIAATVKQALNCMSENSTILQLTASDNIQAMYFDANVQPFNMPSMLKTLARMPKYFATPRKLVESLSFDVNKEFSILSHEGDDSFNKNLMENGFAVPTPNGIMCAWYEDKCWWIQCMPRPVEVRKPRKAKKTAKPVAKNAVREEWD